MEKPRLNVSLAFIIILAIFIISILTYVSILGENNKIDRVITAYFDNLRDGMYLEACDGFSTSVQEGQLASDDQRMNFNFLLELSLLKRYDLIDNYDYTVALERSNFWIPFISGDSVRVSVLLRKKGGKGVSNTLLSSHNRELTRNLIVVGREKGSWKIRQFSTADSSISGIYNDVQQHIDLNKYVQKTSTGVHLKDTEIDFKTLTPIDKRLLRFSLYKIQKSLGKEITPVVRAKDRVF
jgi:hypothetical protein